MITCDSSISACEKAAKWLEALALLEDCAGSLEASVVTYNASLSQEAWQQALELFCDARTRQVSCDLVTYNTAMSACEGSLQWQIAFQLFPSHSSSMSADIITYATAICAYEKVALWQQAMMLLEECAHRVLKSDVVACNSSLNACEKAAQWQQSICRLVWMRLLGLKADGRSHDAVISSCEKASEWQPAFGIFTEEG